MENNMKVDLVIVGGGPAGMSAAVAAYDKGLKNILILERESAPGGVLRQCIHNGFGLHRFGEDFIKKAGHIPLKHGTGKPIRLPEDFTAFPSAKFSRGNPCFSGNPAHPNLPLPCWA